MERYRVAPARPVFLSSGATHHHHHVQAPPPPLCGPAGRRSDGAELDIFTAERYFNAADATKYRAAIPVDSPPAAHLAMDAAASQSGRTAASSEASWNSRSGLLASNSNNNQSARQQQADKGPAYSVGAAANGGLVDSTRDGRYHRAKKPAGHRWGLFSRVDCPCVGRKAVTVGVASEPPSPRTQHASCSAAMDQEISAIFKAHRLLPSPSPTHEPEPSTTKIVSTTGSRAFPLRANNNNSDSGILATPAPNKGVSFDVFLAPDLDRRVVVSSSGGAAGFTFPVAIGPATNVIVGSDEPPRESLEVFRPIDEDSVLLLAGPPSLSAAAFLRAPAPAATEEEDAMSDASSDLFDLESFAASSSYPTTCRGRGSSRRNSREEEDDDASLPRYASAMAMAEPALSECMYAASEASVVWSVATAEGFAPYDAAPSVANFSSAASACGAADGSVQPPAAGGGFTAAMSRSAAGRKKGGGFLNSCRCEKAVSVGPTPVRVARPRPPAETAMALESGGAARYHHGRVHMPVRT